MVEICVRLDNGQIVPLTPSAQPPGGLSPMSVGPYSGATPLAEVCIRLSNGQLVLLTSAPQSATQGVGGISPMSSPAGGLATVAPMAELCIRFGNGQIVPLAFGSQAAGGSLPMSAAISPFSSGMSPMSGGACSQSINLNGQMHPLCV